MFYKCSVLTVLLTLGLVILNAQAIYPVADECGQGLSFGDDTELLGILDDQLVFFNQQGDNRSLWVSAPNGTGDTYQVRTTVSASDLVFHTKNENTWFFEEMRGDELVITMFQASTDSLSVIYTAPDGANIGKIVYWNDALYFDEKDGFQDEILVRYDLTTGATTTLFTSDFGGIRGIGTLNDYVIIVTNTEAGKMLVRTDGTIAGTEVLTQLYDSGSEFSPTVRMHSNGEKLFFFYHPNNNPYNLWVTDGTTEGTELLNNYLTTTSSPPRNGVFLDDQFFFIARNAGTPSGFTLELHVSDGTPEGTFTLNDGSDYRHPRLLTPFDGKIYFSSIISGNWGIYSTDGTIANTNVELPPYGQVRSLYNFTAFRDSLIVGGENLDTNTGEELYISDGTPEGTRLLGDLTPGEDDSFPSSFVSDSNNLFFLTGVSGTKELWVYQPEVANNPNQPLTLADSTIIDVAGSMVGGAVFTVTGGTPPYSFVLNNGQENTDGAFSSLDMGDYELTVTDQNGCSFQLLFTVDVLIGTNEVSGLVDQLAVFPNPVQGDFVYLKLATNTILEQATVEIWTLDGKVLCQQSLTGGRNWQERIDVSSIPAGSYLLVVKNNDQLIGRKMIVK